MTATRPTNTTTAWLAASGLVVGATAIGLGTVTQAAASPSASSLCTGGASLVSSGVCQITFTTSKHWGLPTGVKSLQILTVGGGGGGGGGTTYGAGGGGGGGGVSVCTTSLVDLTGELAVTVGGGGTGGANGSGNLYDPEYGGEFGVVGNNGSESTVTDARALCTAAGGLGGEPGYNYESSALPETPLYGGGGESGTGELGGSAAGLEQTDPNDCTFSNWDYNLSASGGGGAFAQGDAPTDSDSGAGGTGTTPTSGLFATSTATYGGGGGGGAGNDCETYDIRGVGGDGGGGAGGGQPEVLVSGPNARASMHAAHSHELSEPAAGDGVANTGGGGGGGTGEYPGDGLTGGNGGTGVVVIRYAAISPSPINASVYFATASSTLTGADKATLSAFVARAVAQDKTVIKIEGFTDPRGSVAYNAALSVARAVSTAAYVRSLFALDHVTAKITAIGKGEKHTYANDALDRVATLSGQLKAPTAT